MAEAEGFDLMTTCFVCHRESFVPSVHLFLQGEWSAGTKDTAVLTQF